MKTTKAINDLDLVYGGKTHVYSGSSSAFLQSAIPLISNIDINRGHAR